MIKKKKKSCYVTHSKLLVRFAEDFKIVMFKTAENESKLIFFLFVCALVYNMFQH